MAYSSSDEGGYSTSCGRLFLAKLALCGCAGSAFLSSPPLPYARKIGQSLMKWSVSFSPSVLQLGHGLGGFLGLSEVEEVLAAGRECRVGGLTGGWRRSVATFVRKVRC